MDTYSYGVRCSRVLHHRRRVNQHRGAYALLPVAHHTLRVDQYRGVHALLAESYTTEGGWISIEAGCNRCCQCLHDSRRVGQHRGVC